MTPEAWTLSTEKVLSPVRVPALNWLWDTVPTKASKSAWRPGPTSKNELVKFEAV